MERFMLFRSPYNFDTDVSSFATSLKYDPGQDRAQQSFVDECDINTLVKVYARSGIIPGRDIPAMEFNVDEIIDYQTALNRLREADKAFMSFPSDVRDRFKNDPALLLDFISTPSNREEAVALGLIPKPADAPEPVLVRLSEVPPPVNE